MMATARCAVDSESSPATYPRHPKRDPSPDASRALLLQCLSYGRGQACTRAIPTLTLPMQAAQGTAFRNAVWLISGVSP